MYFKAAPAIKTKMYFCFLSKTMSLKKNFNSKVLKTFSKFLSLMYLENNLLFFIEDFNMFLININNVSSSNKFNKSSYLISIKIESSFALYV